MRNIWKEVSSDINHNGNIIDITAFLTDEDKEQGKVIAKVDVSSFEVEYLDKRAKTDRYAQDIINEIFM